MRSLLCPILRLRSLRASSFKLLCLPCLMERSFLFNMPRPTNQMAIVFFVVFHTSSHVAWSIVSNSLLLYQVSEYLGRAKRVPCRVMRVSTGSPP